MLAAVEPCTVLVVEDDQSIREITAEVLETEGFRVLSCSNGADALKLITDEESTPINLLVLDLMLPGLGGLDLQDHLHRRPSRAAVVAVAQSAGARQASERCVVDSSVDEAIISSSHLQRPQRSEWELGGELLEAVVLPGSDEWLLGDQRRLYRAVLNLLDNALRYSPDDDTVDVRILCSGAWWILRIRDHGSDLSESDLKRMFQRSYRGDPFRVRSACRGSGLGLSIVQQIAVNPGGRVEARNHPDGGACLELLLPKGHPVGA